MFPSNARHRRACLVSRLTDIAGSSRISRTHVATDVAGSSHISRVHVAADVAGSSRISRVHVAADVAGSSRISSMHIAVDVAGSSHMSRAHVTCRRCGVIPQVQRAWYLQTSRDRPASPARTIRADVSGASRTPTTTSPPDLCAPVVHRPSLVHALHARGYAYRAARVLHVCGGGFST
ncbi:RNA polymerase beta'' subunit [Dorcoceras hygrometricum]|uniref:RNA polymerase beta'' subunit n=1 Tax=Dorcoceras hygrometricum TaxID=472368 RepID=A0A2Z7CU58_9LAMI|nr:RNA polymerase beta'' subunit [Dorcoceras hygrometricum]